MRLSKQPEITALKTLVKAAFKNAHSDKKVSVTLLEVTMNTVTNWESKRMKNLGNM